MLHIVQAKRLFLLKHWYEPQQELLQVKLSINTSNFILSYNKKKNSS